MKRWVCKNCGYKFNLNNPLDCPYCGKQCIEKEKTATELLKDIEKILNN